MGSVHEAVGKQATKKPDPSFICKNTRHKFFFFAPRLRLQARRCGLAPHASKHHAAKRRFCRANTQKSVQNGRLAIASYNHLGVYPDSAKTPQTPRPKPHQRLASPSYASTDTMPDSPSSTPATTAGLNFAFMRPKLSRWIALGAGSGLARFAPGTVGTLWAWASFLVLQLWLSPFAWALLLVLGFAIGWWACTRTAQDLGLADPGCIVWDEILAFWLILVFLMPAGFWMQLWAFVLFRFFDAAKPQPVRCADSAFKGAGWRGGFGIIFDDLVAALCTLVVLTITQRWMA